MRDDHTEKIDIFRKTVDVEKVLKKQVGATIENLYLNWLPYLQTYMIIMTVAALLTHISASNGLVDASKIAKEEQNISLIVWNLNDPPIILYITVRELVSLAVSGNVTNTQTQIFTICMEMMQKTQDFDTGLR